ncbi:MAG: 50S ribosomal protein L30 [Bacteroidales bacterium]|jgi:large subunit ribosomal protein L30|nr:50S ribosomal protein L30 [Bacteroidales bacterium]
MAKIRITLKRSVIHASKRQVATVRALGLGKVNSSVEHEDTPQILGMAAKVNHLVSVEK